MEEAARQMQRDMVAQVERLDARLEPKLEAMQQANGEEKLAAMRALVEELVAQRGAMHRHMMGMMPRVLDHLAGHVGLTPGMEGLSDHMRVPADAGDRWSEPWPAGHQAAARGPLPAPALTVTTGWGSRRRCARSAVATSGSRGGPLPCRRGCPSPS
ncbi:MAG: hypothetical protein AB1505_00685 [Candidatus Latescibacterota bacterium]